MTIAEQRSAVIREAESWLGTPFVHAASVKGQGTDCVHMPAAVYNQVLGLSIEVPAYSPQWHLHQTEHGKFDELYLKNLISQGFVEISNGDFEVEPFDQDHFLKVKLEPGDFVLAKLARTFSHGAILTDWPNVIQAESSPKGAGMVVRAATGTSWKNKVRSSWFLSHRELKFFSLRIWH